MILDTTSIVNVITKIRSRIKHDIMINHIDLSYSTVYLQVVNTYKLGLHVWIDTIESYGNIPDDSYDVIFIDDDTFYIA
jgi:hypothetical protein